MTIKKQEHIGIFTVVDDKQELRQVIVSQDIVRHYSGAASHTKNLHLDNLEGLEVYKTDDPDIFRLSDGSTLRKINSSRLNR